MKQKITKPAPTLPKSKRKNKCFSLDELVDMEYEDYLGDVERRKRKLAGPSEEAKKLLK